MVKKIFYGALMFLFIFQSNGRAAVASGVTISGIVQRPLQFSMEDLSKFQTISVRLNEVNQEKKFQGVFNYRGVPLRTLLEQAYIQKEETDFLKPVDVAILIRNKTGKQTVLSWGEVFYRNPAEVTIAVSATPVMPQKKCESCHKPEVYEDRFNQHQRPVGFPKLVVANDFYSDRSLEEVTGIEVIDLNPPLKAQKTAKLYSPSFAVSGSIKNPLTIADLSSYPRVEIMTKPVGEGMGYHGLKLAGGVPLVQLLEKAGAAVDINSVCLISAPDGYRSVLSLGELFFSPSGQRILIADRINHQPLDKDGKFILILPDDLSADREVKAVGKIEVIHLKKSPKIYIIGMGCADTSLLTQEALTYLSRADVLVCSEDIKKRYAHYIGDRPILFDPFKVLMPAPIYGQELSKFSHQEREKLIQGKVAEAAKKIRRVLDQGKTVALLEYGDPAVYGSLRGLAAQFSDQEKEVVPGISAFNAANALMGKEMGCKGSIIISTPWGLKDNPAMLRAVAEKGDTLAIFMGLKEIKVLMPLLRKVYPGSTPINFAYRVGYSNRKRLIRTTLDQALEAADQEKEHWLGMIYIGPCLQENK